MARNLDEPGANFNQLLELSLKLQNARTFAGTKVADASTEMEQYPDTYLRPGETLEDWDGHYFRKPNAAGGRVGFNKGGSFQEILKNYWQGMGPWGQGSTGAFYASDLYDALAPYLGMMFSEGGRVGFDKGGMDRRTFLKIMGSLATVPVLGKFVKFTKPAVDFTVKLRTKLFNSDVDYGDSGQAFFDISALTPKVKRVLYGLMKNKAATKPAKTGKDYLNIDPGDAKSVIKELKKSGFKGKITGIVDEGTDVLDDAVKRGKEHPGLKEWADTFKKQSMKQNIKQHSKRNYVVYENDPGWIKHMDEVINASSKSTTGKAADKVIHKPWTSTIDEVVDLLEPVVKKAKGGRIYGKYAQQLASGGRVGYDKGDVVLPKAKPSEEEIKTIKWGQVLNILKKAKGGMGHRSWLNFVSDHLDDGLKAGIISKEQFNKAIMPLFGQSGEAHTRALEKDDSLPVKDLLEIQGEKREDYPDYLLAKGGRVGLAEGDTPSQAWMRNNFFESGYDNKGVITLYEYMNGPIGWSDYMSYGPGAS